MKASASSWKREPFKWGIALAYSASFNAEEFALLKDGLIPEEMEDKWFIYYEEPHLFFHRSWTGLPVYRVTLQSEAAGGATAIEALWSKEDTQPSATNQDYEAQVLDFLVSNLLLHQSKPFPLPVHFAEPVHGVLQHAVAGTAFPQSPESKPGDSGSRLKRRKPWWRPS
jgi:hypothetical protein